MNALENKYLVIKKEDLQEVTFAVCGDIQTFINDNPDKKDSFFVLMQTIKEVINE